jgi:CheY-like chemotaxis protein
VSNKTIVQLENGRQTASFVTIEKLCRVLGVEPRDVREFAHALAERAGVAFMDEALDDTIRPRPTQVFCVSGATVFHTLTRRLLDTERYGVLTAIGVRVSAAHVACLQPDVLILDLDAGPALVLELLRDLRTDTATSSIPVIVTGRDRRWLDSVASDLTLPGQPAVAVAPFTPDLRELLTTIESLAILR